MDQGTMIIKNSQGSPTTLVISGNLVSATPSDNAIVEVTNALKEAKASRSPILGEVKFLTEWIEKFKLMENEILEGKQELDAFKLKQEQEKQD